MRQHDYMKRQQRLTKPYETILTNHTTNDANKEETSNKMISFLLKNKWGKINITKAIFIVIFLQLQKKQRT